MSLLVATFMASLLSTQVGGQEIAPVVVPEEPTCPQCTVRVQTLFTAGGANGSPRITTIPASLVVDKANRLWVFGGDAPVIFDSTGREIGTVALSRTRGAALNVYDASAGGDSVVVLDQTSQSAFVLGPDLKHVREIPFDLPLAGARILRWPDFVAGVGLLPSLPARGWPIHRISLAGGRAEVLESFGPGNGQLRAGTAETNNRLIAPGVGDEFWSFVPRSYRLVQWDRSLQARQVIERRPGWFSGAEGPPFGGPRTPPPAAVRAVQVDSLGLLWVFVSVPSENWPSAWPPARPGLVEVPVSRVAYEKLYRTAIEVIDPRAGRVVARAFTDAWIYAVLPKNRAVTYATTASGRPIVSVVSLAIDRGESR